MNTQVEINFITDSPINIGKLSGQNKRLYDWLKEGKHINCMAPAMGELRIGYLNSRISDLRNKHGVKEIKDKSIQVEWMGEITTVKDYWLETDNTGN